MTTGGEVRDTYYIEPPNSKGVAIVAGWRAGSVQRDPSANPHILMVVLLATGLIIQLPNFPDKAYFATKLCD